MKLSIAVVAFAGLTFAQDISGILAATGFPSCATACIQKASKQLGCSPLDPKCSCDPNNQKAVAKCLQNESECNAADVAKMSAKGNDICKQIGAGGPVPIPAMPAPPASTADSHAGMDMSNPSASAAHAASHASASAAVSAGTSAAAAAKTSVAAAAKSAGASAASSAAKAASASAGFALPTQVPTILGALGAAAALAL